jgi:hypothetical protein
VCSKGLGEYHGGQCAKVRVYGTNPCFVAEELLPHRSKHDRGALCENSLSTTRMPLMLMDVIERFSGWSRTKFNMKEVRRRGEVVTNLVRDTEEVKPLQSPLINIEHGF